MRKVLLLSLAFLFVFGTTTVNAQKGSKKEKTKKEKTKKDKKKGKKKKEDPFIYETKDSEDYQKADRAEISKPEMPKYDVDQTFQKGKKKKKQQAAFQNRKYYYPAKPHNAWQIGIHGGFSMVNGDVSPQFFRKKSIFPGHNFGLSISKSWSYLFSTRLRYSTFNMLGQNPHANTFTIQHATATGLAGAYGVTGNAGTDVYHNFRAQGHDLMFDAIFSIGNVKFHKERTNVLFKAFPTVGFMMHRTFTDMLDANGNAYDFKGISQRVRSGDLDKDDVIKTLYEMRDGVYETNAEQDGSTILGGYNPVFAFGAGVGITFRLAKWIYLDIETRQHFTTDDLIDGVQWEEPEGVTNYGRALTANFDSYNHTTIGLTFNLVGKKTTEPLTMLNPMHYSHQKIAEADPEKAIDDLLKDDDGDGVPNRLDKEDDTPEGAPVDPSGVALDSDGDGIIDLNDSEVYSPEGPVDEKGVSQYGTLGDLKKDVEELKNAEKGVDCSKFSDDLPSVHFDKDWYNIKPEFYSSLYLVAQRMQLCPDVKVVAIGTADRDHNLNYNDQLSYNRVMTVINFMADNYGVDKNRFIIKFEGKREAKGVTAFQQYKERSVVFKVAKAGETGTSNPNAPFPNIKAGKK